MSAHTSPLAAVVAAESARLEETGATTIDLEQLRAVVDTMVPFSNHVGVRVTGLTPEYGQAELPERLALENHVGSVHAGALFVAAEVAGSAAFAGAMAPRILALEGFVLRSSRIAFLRPGKGRIRARATVDRTVTDAVLARSGAESFELPGAALLRDDADVLVARVDLEYLVRIGA
jgi:acyl-coenzyme A thioesterase PaaI-like protein